MSSNLIPTYLEADFNTLKSKLIHLMQQTETFKDYNYEGANITMLMELVSYIGDLNTFYNNIIAKNVFPDTADIYEVVHSQTSHLGFMPRGWRSSTTELQITLNRQVEDKEGYSYLKDGYDNIFIPAWFTINTREKDNNDNDIFYCTTKDFYYDINTTEDIIIFNIPLRQGEPEHLEYTGVDIVNNQIILPFYNFDHETFPYREDLPAIELSVNDYKWNRIPDAYDLISGLDYENIENTDNVYMFKYDKYGRYIIEFSSIRNKPKETDDIKISLVKSLGINGKIGANIIIDNPIIDILTGVDFLTNQRDDNTTIIIDKDYYSITNPSASIGGSDPDTIPELKEAGKLEIHSQKRNINTFDYIGSLQSKGDIIKANVWGENEIDPGNTLYYNKIYMSIIPTSFDDSTIRRDFTPLTEDNLFTSGLTGDIEIPIEYNEDWKESILRYIEPRKHICTHEIFVLPDLVYFKFEIDVRIKRLYQFENVKNDILNKLVYYFDASNRKFNEIIDFRNIYNWLLDDSVILDDNNRFNNIRGVNSLVFRDIVTYTNTNINDPLEIFPIDSDTYPKFVNEDFSNNIDNILRPIKLGFNQFPMLKKEFCIIKEVK